MFQNEEKNSSMKCTLVVCVCVLDEGCELYTNIFLTFSDFLPIMEGLSKISFIYSLIEFRRFINLLNNWAASGFYLVRDL